jgi:hypothetical protein
VDPRAGQQLWSRDRVGEDCAGSTPGEGQYEEEKEERKDRPSPPLRRTRALLPRRRSKLYGLPKEQTLEKHPQHSEGMHVCLPDGRKNSMAAGLALLHQMINNDDKQ